MKIGKIEAYLESWIMTTTPSYGDDKYYYFAPYYSMMDYTSCGGFGEWDTHFGRHYPKFKNI